MTASSAIFRDSLLWPMLGAAAVLKVVLVLWLGPVFFPDSSGYSYIAERMLADGSWLTERGDAVDTNMVFRTIGYPLVIMPMMVVFGTAWASATAILQSLVSVAALIPVLRVTETVTNRAWAGRLVLVLYTMSGSLLYDQAILTDSLNASIFILVAFTIIGWGCGLWRLGLWRILGLGVAYGLGIWMREAGLYLAVIPLGLILVAALRRRVMFGENALRLIVTRASVFVLAIAILSGTYMSWNQYRLDEAFIGGTGHINWLQAPVYGYIRGYGDPFTGDGVVDTAVRQTSNDRFAGMHQLHAVFAVLNTLRKRDGLTDREMARLAKEKWRQTLEDHPGLMLRNTLRNLAPEKMAFLIAHPLFNANEYFQLGPGQGERLIAGSSGQIKNLRKDFSVGGALVLGADMGLRAISLVLFVVFVLGPPIWFARRGKAGNVWLGPALIALQCWAGYLVFSLSYALVYTELRYFMPIIPLAQVALVATLVAIINALRSQRGSSSDPGSEARPL
ncbi:MAG: hypothetical protein CL566_03965 [Alphaproteobacteria bacterium]|nr:hypothetical protein [Alphaproteobacteria bacterium]